MSEWHSSAALWERLKRFAQENRRLATRAESSLWQALRGRQLGGYRFRRQHAIRQFIVDFYCHDAKLIIEVDGSSRDGATEYDAERQTILEALGFRVLRFTNDEVLKNLPAVLQRISKALNAAS